MSATAATQTATAPQNRRGTARFTAGSVLLFTLTPATDGLYVRSRRQWTGNLMRRGPSFFHEFGRAPEAQVGPEVALAWVLSRDTGKMDPRNPHGQMMREVVIKM